MQFGKVDQPELVNFTLPDDHPGTEAVLQQSGYKARPLVYVGCSKWIRADLKGFYPRGTKDELSYYATRFNSIEFNASFYNFYTSDQYRVWKDKTPPGFRFFPKVNRTISHIKRLRNADRYTDEMLQGMLGLEEKLGMVFIQMHENFSPGDLDWLENYLDRWPREVRLAVEVRHTDWLNDEAISENYYDLLESKALATVITDTPGRRDLIHMRLTTPAVFVRFVSAYHECDYERLDDWFDRLQVWIRMDIENICFFIHQNLEETTPMLSEYFVKRLNDELGYQLPIPHRPQQQTSLF